MTATLPPEDGSLAERATDVNGAWVDAAPNGDGNFDENLDQWVQPALAGELDDDPDEMLAALGLEFVDGRTPSLSHNWPVVAVLGRPNVGKSTLVNRILGRREAVVEDLPGVTRDRVRYEAQWGGRDFILMDTGGIGATRDELASAVSEQALRALDEADVVMFVVDAQVGATDADEAVVSVLRKSKLPTVLIANKVDDERTEADAARLWSLGLGEPWPVSALHGRGSGDALDAIVACLPDQARNARDLAGPHRIALVGRPNVGKSSLLNSLAGHERVVVHHVAGTTVDPVDEVITLDDEPWVLVDTAGIRRKVDHASGHEWYASLRTQTAVERADIALVVVDASAPLAEQDVRIASLAEEAGRAIVVVFNKWDLVDEERQKYLEREYEQDLQMISWAPRINIAAKTAWHTNRILPALRRSLHGWQTRVATSALNRFVAELVAEFPHPVRGGKQSKILFATQAGVRPPSFVLFTTGPLDAGYRRFVERKLRERFGFEGSPIRITVRVRERRQR
ncbi:MAG: hypothetical protein RL745_827 [Actinomycetota bacterium]|jgi:GTP-binding protein